MISICTKRLFSRLPTLGRRSRTSRPLGVGALVVRARRSGVGLLAVLCTLAGVLVLGAGPALASRSHVFEKTFGEPCTTTPCGNGQFSEPSGVAVNEATGDVYVVDKGNNRVEYFTAGGVYVGEFKGPSATGSGNLTEGSATIESVLATSGAFSVGEELDGTGLTPGTTILAVKAGGVLEISQPVEAGKSGLAVELKAHQSFSGPEGVAIDNTCHLHEQTSGKPLSTGECEALDPSNGDVYVVDTGHDVIDKFSLTGAYIGQLAESASGSLFGALEGVAVDAEGKVWVYQGSGEIDSFSDALANEFQASRSSPFGTGPGFAVDSQDNLYVRRGEPYFAKLDSTGKKLLESVDNEPSTAAAVDLSSNDGSSNDVYIDNGTTVGKFSTAKYNENREEYEGTLIERFGSGHLTNGSGIAVSSTSGNVYVADAATDAVDIFNLPPTPPTIDNTSTGTITSESAELRASINPNGDDTTYHFEYGTSTAYEASTPEVDIGSGQIDQAVTQDVTGLQPNTTYHFRVVAHNILGTETGQDDTFVYDTAGEGLPDGRAYEMVTPLQKAGSTVDALPATVAADGSSLAGACTCAFAGVSNAEIPPLGSVFYRFTRTASGWTTAPLQIPRGLGQSIGVEDSLWAPANLGFEVDHLSLREADGSVSDIGPVWLPALGLDPTESGISYNFQGAAGEASHGVVFTIGEAGLLWPFDTNVEERSLYEYVGVNNSEPMLVGVSGGPGSTTLIGQCGTELGADVFRGSQYNAISESGQSVFFTAAADSSSLSPTSTSTWASTSTCASGGKTGTAPPTDELYARLGGSETVWVSEPQCTPASACHNVTTEPYATREASEEAGVVFEGASADGSKVFFTTTQQLTNSDTDATRTRDLYEYDFNEPVGQRLTQVSAGGSGDATPGAGADVEGVSRISEDGSHVYFVANGVLTTSPSRGAQGYNGHGVQVATGAVAQPGADNLYVYEPDPADPGRYETVFIAELCSGPGASGGVADVQCPSNLNSNPWNYGSGSANDQVLWSHKGGDERPLQATPDGRFVVFPSYGDLTADDTSTARQVFQYDAQTGGLVRVSVGQDGFDNNGNTTAGREGPTSADTANASIGTQHYDETGRQAGFTRGGAIARTMSDNGSYVFFQSPVGLTSQALNDVPIDSEGDLAQNVYEYHDGHVSLISDGRDSSELEGGSSSVSLIGTDASGADVFFTTVDPLVPQDTDTQLDIYDARIGGGFPAASPSECQGEACQGVQGPPSSLGAPASATFSGTGNLAPPSSPKPKAKAKPLTRAQKLAKALQACAKKPKKKRRDCKSRARNRYGHTARAKKSDRSGK